MSASSQADKHPHDRLADRLVEPQHVRRARRYSAVNQDTAAGNFAAAADRYAEALALLPETHANHESRALALTWPSSPVPATR